MSEPTALDVSGAYTDTVHALGYGRPPLPIAQSPYDARLQVSEDGSSFGRFVTHPRRLFRRTLRFEVLARVGHASSHGWLRDLLVDWSRDARYGCYRATLLAPTVGFVHELVAGAGIRPSTLFTVGEVARGLAGLRSGPDPDVAGFTIRPAEPRDQAAIIGLSRRITLERDHRIFPDAVLPHARTIPSDHFVLERDGDVYGLGGVLPSLVTDTRALEIMTHPIVRRRGFARAIYRALLERARAQDVALVIGASAHPATLHLAAEMGRRAYAIVFDSRATHPPEPVLAGLERLARVPVSAPSAP